MVAITGDWTAFELRRLAAASKYASQSKRLLSLVAVLAGMGRQTLNDWVRQFNARGPKG
ncbi:hypothetical protein EZH22_09405 [Xanthobacter dioxanivorans]|uniref:Helix-turn-helix domain-containing protein n=1 Tax=Xanthobacter dioxanivorans TaxID=2528964 RepID=A0A974PSJ1_9HYPH|nr:hypothetical protein [Xanthobacter dioxanivorans]QRG08478.1 hypothetical protein EZH22_09405 [Xanthobacter dioxanivorans]